MNEKDVRKARARGDLLLRGSRIDWLMLVVIESYFMMYT